MIAAAAGVGAVVLSTIGVWPQTFRARRHSTQGVSPGSVMLVAVTSTLWLGYTFKTADRFGFVATVSIGVAIMLTFLALRRDGRVERPWFSVALLAIGAAACVSVVCPAAVSGVCAMALGVIAAMPQARRMWVDRRVEGVSALSWALIAAENASWVLYGSVTGHWLYIPAAAIQMVAGLYIAVTAHRSQHQGHRAFEPSCV